MFWCAMPSIPDDLMSLTSHQNQASEAAKAYRVSYERSLSHARLRMIWIVATISTTGAGLWMARIVWGGELTRLLYAGIPLFFATLSLASLLRAHRQAEFLSRRANPRDVEDINTFCSANPELRAILIEGSKGATQLTNAHVFAVNDYVRVWSEHAILLDRAPRASSRKTPNLAAETEKPGNPMPEEFRGAIEEIQALGKNILVAGKSLPPNHPELLRVKDLLDIDLPEAIHRYNSLCAGRKVLMADGEPANLAFARVLQDIHSGLVNVAELVDADSSHDFGTHLRVLIERYGQPRHPL